jgi:hypothetical protein
LQAECWQQQNNADDYVVPDEGLYFDEVRNEEGNDIPKLSKSAQRDDPAYILHQKPLCFSQSHLVC